MTSNKTDTVCVFCLGAEASAKASLIVYERKTCYVILNLYPYNNGHLLIVPYRHTPSLASLTTEEAHETADLMQLCERALLEAYQPHGVNVGVNLGKPAGAGVLEHVHVHVVPRWNGDTNFMPVLADVRVMPEHLSRTLEQVRAAWPARG